jgi:hypothetical protein
MKSAFFVASTMGFFERGNGLFWTLGNCIWLCGLWMARILLSTVPKYVKTL